MEHPSVSWRDSRSTARCSTDIEGKIWGRAFNACASGCSVHTRSRQRLLPADGFFLRLG
jgi:hypothetical protein